MNIKDYIKNNRLFLDGGMGTVLQANGLRAGELPETWNLTHPDVICGVHRSYFDAGSHVVNTNTFGANLFKFSPDELEQIIAKAIENARNAAAQSSGTQPKWVALDIGPTGKILAPFGDLDFEDAVCAFAQTVRLGVKYGADLIFIETMGDCYETKAALLAAKENSDLPVFVSNAYGENGRLMTGADPAVMIAMLEGMGADAIGVNCSLGPKALSPIARKYLSLASVPVILKPNAGLPVMENGKAVYSITPADFATEVAPLLKEGIGIVGGCCGTTPEYIASVARIAKDIPFTSNEPKSHTVITGYTRSAVLQDSVVIGQPAHPTEDVRYKEALIAKDMDYILDLAMEQQYDGAEVISVDVSLPEIDQKQMLQTVIGEIQTVSNLPVQICLSDIEALEPALRRYNGKAMIRLADYNDEDLGVLFSVVKKYGGVISLSSADQGIPAKAQEYGINKKNIVFET